MKKFILLLFIVLLPKTFWGYDYFLSMNCTGLSGVSGDIDAARLSSCVNDLINGINETRKMADAVNKKGSEKIGRVDSNVEIMEQTIRNLVNESIERLKNERAPDQVMHSLSAQMEKEIEKHAEENDSKIDQLEKRISALEALLSDFTDEVQPSAQETNKEK